MPRTSHPSAGSSPTRAPEVGPLTTSPTTSWPGTNGAEVRAPRSGDARPPSSARAEPQIPLSRGHERGAAVRREGWLGELTGERTALLDQAGCHQVVAEVTEWLHEEVETSRQKHHPVAAPPVGTDPPDRLVLDPRQDEVGEAL